MTRLICLTDLFLHILAADNGAYAQSSQPAIRATVGSIKCQYCVNLLNYSPVTVWAIKAQLGSSDSDYKSSKNKIKCPLVGGEVVRW